MKNDRPTRANRTYRDPVATGDLVFVYGTLRRGERFHDIYLPDAEFVGDATTVDRYRLRDLGAFPAAEHITSEPGAPGRGLVGEVYRVDEQTGRDLDALENNGGLYRRALRSVYSGNTGVSGLLESDLVWLTAWVFEIINPRWNEPIIESGDWLNRIGG